MFLKLSSQVINFVLKTLYFSGDSGVGKSNLLLRYTKNEFDPQFKGTIGAEFAYKTINIGKKKIRLQIWDTSGSEQFRSVTSAYYKGALGALLVYDISKKTTFEGLNKWLTDLRNTVDANAAILLVGNKSDLGEFREVSIVEAAEYAERNNLAYIESSALEASNVEEAFQSIVEGI